MPVASRNAAIAEAVKAALNAHTFSQAFTARRVYVPGTKLKDLGTLTVTVFAGGDNQSIASRSQNLHEILIDVGIQKRLTAAADPETEAANDEIDNLVALAEEVADVFKAGAYGPGRWAATTLALPSVDHLRQHQTFTATATLTFKLLA